jgi:hypothetical protein
MATVIRLLRGVLLVLAAVLATLAVFHMTQGSPIPAIAGATTAAALVGTAVLLGGAPGSTRGIPVPAPSSVEPVAEHLRRGNNVRITGVVVIILVFFVIIPIVGLVLGFSAWVPMPLLVPAFVLIMWSQARAEGTTLRAVMIRTWKTKSHL